MALPVASASGAPVEPLHALALTSAWIAHCKPLDCKPLACFQLPPHAVPFGCGGSSLTSNGLISHGLSPAPREGFLIDQPLCATAGLAGRAPWRELRVTSTVGGGDGRDRHERRRQDGVRGRCAADLGRRGSPGAGRAVWGRSGGSQASAGRLEPPATTLNP